MSNKIIYWVIGFIVVASCKEQKTSTTIQEPVYKVIKKDINVSPDNNKTDSLKEFSLPFGNELILTDFPKKWKTPLENDYIKYLEQSKNNYKLKHIGELEKGPKFDLKSNIYLRYAHISKSFVKVGDKVVSGDVIGLSGVTGNATGTKAPHLHFEIANLPRPGKGLINRCNPAFYVNLKDEDKADKDYQKKISNTRHKI